MIIVITQNLNKIKQIPKMDILYSGYSRKNNKKNRVGDISSLFQRHCQTNRLFYKVQSWQDVVSQSSEAQ